MVASKDDKLMSDSEDKKQIYKAKREAKRLSKRKRASSSAAAAKMKVPTTGSTENAMLGPLKGAIGNQNTGVYPE